MPINIVALALTNRRTECLIQVCEFNGWSQRFHNQTALWRKSKCGWSVASHPRKAIEAGAGSALNGAMETINASHAISEVIQLAVAPVFLLVAIGSMLNVMTQRLGRVIDRARVLEDLAPATPDHKLTPMHRQELIALDRRMSYVQWAISLNAVSALLIAFLVALIFLSDLASFNTAQAIAVLFILAMAGIILGLCAFLMEIFIATRTVRVRAELLKT